MALQTIPGGGFAFPHPTQLWHSSGNWNHQINATDEKVAGIFRIPKDGTISDLIFTVGALTTPQTLRVGIETVDSSGNPTGIQYGGSAVGTVTPTANTQFEVSLGTDATVTAPDLVAVVIQFDSTVGDLNITGMDVPGGSRQGFPYINFYTTSWAKQQGGIVNMGIKYDDGSYEYTGALLLETNVGQQFNNTSTPDERGLYFSLPGPFRIYGFWMVADIDNNADIILYDSDGSTELTSLSLTSGPRGATATQFYNMPFASPQVLLANTNYRLILKPTSASNIDMRYITLNSSLASIMAMWPGGTTVHWTSRTDAGSWTQDTARRPLMGLLCDQMDNGVGGAGGGLITHPGTSGGMRG